MNSKQDLLSVGEIARTMGLTRRIILNYEAHDLIHADTRGDSNTGYRYYSMDTLARIRTIRTYQKLGLSLDEIKNYLDGSADLTPMLKRLEALRDELEENIAQLRERMKQHKQSEIFFTTLPAYTVYVQRAKDETLERKINRLRDTAYAAVTKHGTDTSKRMYFTESSLNDPDTITYCAAVPKSSKGDEIVEQPETKAIVKYHYGSYTHLPEVRQELLTYAGDHKLQLCGTCRYIYLEGPPQHKDPKNYITLVALLLEQ